MPKETRDARDAPGAGGRSRDARPYDRHPAAAPSASLPTSTSTSTSTSTPPPAPAVGPTAARVSSSGNLVLVLKPSGAGGRAQGQEPRPEPEPLDAHRIAQRQKQVDYGKNTLAYDNYVRTVPRDRRVLGKDPMTPDVHDAVSKRAFDGRIRVWRRQLHVYSPAGADGAGDVNSAVDDVDAGSMGPLVVDDPELAALLRDDV